MSIKNFMEGLMNRKETFGFTDKHIQIIREMIVVWDSSESGAPIVDIYGPNDPYKRFAALLGFEITKDNLEAETAEFERLKFEVGSAFEIFLSFAELAPGQYTYANPLPDAGYEETTVFISSDSEKTMPIPMEKTIAFDFTQSHAKLIKACNGRWLDYYYRPGINSKRPYGDRTYYPLDMADILGLDYPLNSEGYKELPESKVDELKAMHREMWQALQTFLKHARIDPGKYSRTPAGFGVWEKVR